MLDVDDFKLCNDKYGHLLGDKVLSAIGKWMEREFSDGIIAHYGGDELDVYKRQAQRDGKELICVVMGAPNWFNDAYTLMEYGFKRLEE